jgi:ribose 5-phosphate isomerase B
MKIAFANDHAAVDERGAIVEQLRSMGHEVIDMGVTSAESVDYPDYAAKAAGSLSRGEVDRAVMMCGSGVGMCIVANHFPHVRCVLATDLYSAKMSRAHNDANAIALRAREQDPALNAEILRVWMTTEFEGGRHKRRVDKIEAIGKIKYE